MEPTAGIEPATYSLIARAFDYRKNLVESLFSFFAGNASVYGVAGVYAFIAHWLDECRIFNSMFNQDFLFELTVNDSSWVEDLAAWQRVMRAQGLADRTIDERVRVVRQLAKDLGCSPIFVSVDEIATWVAVRGSATSKACAASSLRAWFRYLVTVGKRSDNPMETIRPKRPRSAGPRPIDPRYVAEVLAKNLRIRTRAMILLAYYEGLRVHEIAKVRSTDFSLDVKELSVVGKGGVHAVIPVHSVVSEIVPVMPRGWWFPSYVSPGPMTGRAVSKIIKDQFASVGCSMTAHQLRHTLASELLAQGVDIRYIQQILRHGSLQTTAIYTGTTFSELAVALEKLPLGFIEPKRE